MRTTSSSHKPAPASRVSLTWSSKLSSLPKTAATPPCARLVAVSTSSFLVITQTLPKPATFNENDSPAMPLPITKKSTFIAPPKTQYVSRETYCVFRLCNHQSKQTNTVSMHQKRIMKIFSLRSSNDYFKTNIKGYNTCTKKQK